MHLAETVLSEYVVNTLAIVTLVVIGVLIIGVPVAWLTSCCEFPGRRMLEAIGNLPEGEREALDLVKIQGLTHAEAAGVLGVSLRTVKRWVSRGLRLLSAQLADLGPG